MFVFIILQIFCGLSINFVDSAKILGFFPGPFYSHQIVYQEIWKALALRGHNITVITPNPIKNASIRTLREIDVNQVSYEVSNKFNIEKIGTTRESQGISWKPFLEMSIGLIHAQLSQPEVKSIIENSNGEKYDLIIVEAITPIPLPLKGVYKCPIITIQSMPLHNEQCLTIGNPFHQFLTPDSNFWQTRNMTFIQRLQSVLLYYYEYVLLQLRNHRTLHVLQKYYTAVDLKDVNQLLEEPNLLFVNQNPVLEIPRPRNPNVIYMSGVHMRASSPLPKDLMEFLNGTTEGVVYMSLGSTIKSSVLPVDRLNVFFEAFGLLPCKVLWKFETENITSFKIPSNLKILPWTPQQDVLRHPNVKLFITQGGLQSVEEALYTAVPMLIIPFFGDQFGNAKKVSDIGLGQTLNIWSLDSKMLSEKILELFNNKTYLQRAEELYKLAIDQPMTGLETVIWWTEYVIRHKGAEHLKTLSKSYPSYQIYYLDIYAFLILIIVILVILLKLLFKGFQRLVKKIYVKDKTV